MTRGWHIRIAVAHQTAQALDKAADALAFRLEVYAESYAARPRSCPKWLFDRVDEYARATWAAERARDRLHRLVAQRDAEVYQGIEEAIREAFGRKEPPMPTDSPCPDYPLGCVCDRCEAYDGDDDFDFDDLDDLDDDLSDDALFGDDDAPRPGHPYGSASSSGGGVPGSQRGTALPGPSAGLPDDDYHTRQAEEAECHSKEGARRVGGDAHQSTPSGALAAESGGALPPSPEVACASDAPNSAAVAAAELPPEPSRESEARTPDGYTGTPHIPAADLSTGRHTPREAAGSTGRDAGLIARPAAPSLSHVAELVHVGAHRDRCACCEWLVPRVDVRALELA